MFMKNIINELNKADIFILEQVPVSNDDSNEVTDSPNE